jgi:hypothetical protein
VGRHDRAQQPNIAEPVDDRDDFGGQFDTHSAIVDQVHCSIICGVKDNFRIEL